MPTIYSGANDGHVQSFLDGTSYGVRNQTTALRARATDVSSQSSIMVFYNAGIDELIKVRQEIADMKAVSESDANEFKNRFVQRINPDDKGLGALMEEHDDF